MAEEQTRGTMRVYGCGGAGVNVTSYFNGMGIENGCAEIFPAYIDASRSNMDATFNDDDIFVLDNVDGSGKVRRENHAELNNVTRQILLQIPPKDFNVVVFSASGGTGSVAGPLIVAELLERKESVVALVIGSDESIITANNTLNTLKSLESVSRSKQLPVVMYYQHNERGRKQTDINSEFQLAISTLTILTSRKNHGMDTKDIENWVQFSSTTSVSPQLALLDIFKLREDAEEVGDPISVASVYQSRDEDHVNLTPEYHTDGYCGEPNDHFQQLHFVITIDEVSKLADRISKTLAEYENRRSSRVKQSSILGADDKTDGDLVL